jgi:aryl-alcohol dehydrogenase-like predicted oxidoreductase
MIKKLILGTAQFGLNYGINNTCGKPNEDKIRQMLDFAYTNNIEWLDTADAYGNANELIGQYFRDHGQRFKINTKFKGISDSITNQLKSSLAKLNIKHVDTYFYHSYDDFKNKPEFLNELLKLKASKLIKKIGLSVYDNHEFEKATLSSEIDVIQFPFNLLDNLQQRGNLMKLAKSKGKQLQARSVFLQGLFFKNYDKMPAKLNSLKPYLILINRLSQQYNIEIEHLALAYVMQQPEIDYIIIGVDNIMQLQRNIQIAEKPIDDQIINTIDQICVQETELLYPKNWGK